MRKELIATLYENQVYLKLIDELKKMRPVVPQYDWAKQNVEEIKAKSSQQQGFDLALSVITLNGEAK